MNILIINLTRFGDLLQLQPTILGLEAQGHRVCLVCLENFRTATTLLRGIEHVIAIPGSKFLKELDDDWRLALSKVEDIIEDIDTHFPVHMVINTTSTLGARLLAKRIATAAGENIPILGFGLDADGFGISGDSWTTFLEGASTERLNCPYNLVDMFRSICKISKLPPLWGLQYPNEQIQARSRKLLMQNMPEGCQGFVGFQLGASNEIRQWPVQYFAQLGAKLWQEHKLCPVLLGTQAEQHLEDAYVKLAKDIEHPVISTIGTTDIPHLAGVLTQCKLLVSNDTGTMHLAAGLKIPTLAIFLATAQPWDTGPYMPHCCCLEPALPCHPCAFHRPCVCGSNEQACLHSIKSDDAFYLASHYLTHKTWPKYAQEHIRVWQTIQDENGFANLISLSGHEHEARSSWLMLQRHFYRQILDNDLQPNPESINFHIPTALKLEISPIMQQATALLLLLEKQIDMMQQMPSSQQGERLLVTNNKLHNLLNNCVHLKALGHLWATLSQEQGGDLESFYQLVKQLRTILMQWHALMDKHGT